MKERNDSLKNFAHLGVILRTVGADVRDEFFEHLLRAVREIQLITNDGGLLGASRYGSHRARTLLPFPRHALNLLLQFQSRHEALDYGLRSRLLRGFSHWNRRRLFFKKV